MIRPATRADLETMVSMGGMFHAETVLTQVVPYQADHARNIINSLIESEAAYTVVMVHKNTVVGGFIGVLAPTWFNQQVVMAQQLCWYVMPQFRSREALAMLKGFKEWAGERGAVWLATGFKMQPQYQGMASVLRRDGWLPLEEQWIRRL